MATNRLAITLPEYDRIFRVVYSVSRSVDGTPGASCLFYNTIGALLLEKSLGLRAKPVMGAAVVRVHDASNTVLTFAQINDGSDALSSSEKKFHCWVETDRHIIDFTAPLYTESLSMAGSVQQLPRKMFQKLKTDMAPSHLGLHAEGEFFMLPNPTLTAHFLRKALQSPATGDLANVCLTWFKRPPKPMRNSITMINDLGELTTIREIDLGISGAW